MCIVKIRSGNRESNAKLLLLTFYLSFCWSAGLLKITIQFNSILKITRKLTYFLRSN
jgi:hypothetical protein